MGRFRLEGNNWEPRPYIVSGGLRVLLGQVEELDPVRRPGDGTVASKAHDSLSPSSDHRPFPYTGPGVVRAADIGEWTDAWADELVHAIRESRDTRIKYIISDGMSCWSVPRNGFDAWEWQPYNGANPHETHAHLSVLPKADTDLREWDLTAMAFTAAQEKFLKDLYDSIVTRGGSGAEPGEWADQSLADVRERNGDPWARKDHTHPAQPPAAHTHTAKTTIT